MNDILFEVKNKLGIVSLNRPKALNALTHDMIKQMLTTLTEWQRNDDVHAVIIQSYCEKAFCAGGDIRNIYEMGKQTEPVSSPFFKDEYALNLLIGEYQKPYIALMDGITMGGGVGISLHSPYTVATSNFLFAMPETAIGFFPDIGGAHLLNQCPGEIGMYLALTGARLRQADAFYAELVHYCFEAKQFPELIDDLQASNIKNDVDAILKKYHQAPGESSLEKERAWIDSVFSLNTLSDIQETLGERKKCFDNLSPTSLKVTFKHMRDMKDRTLAECLEADYALTSQFLSQPDFFEGVRALLIDKDRQPKWQS